MSTLTTRIISEQTEFEQLQAAWQELYQLCNKSTIFSSWEWMYSWWEVFHDQFRRQLWIIAVYDQDVLVGIAPFQIVRVIPESFIEGKTLTFIGCKDATRDQVITQYADLIIRPDYEYEVMKAIRNVILEKRNMWDFADFPFVLQNAYLSMCLGDNLQGIFVNARVQGGRFIIPRYKNFDEYLNSLSGRWRKMFHKKMRLLKRDGEMNFQTSNIDIEADDALALLKHMHCERWEGKAEHFIFNSERFYRFHQIMLQRLGKDHRAEIKILQQNKYALAAYYTFQDKQQIHYYQSGFFKEHSNRYSPLFLLVCHEIGESIKKELLFDFMYGDKMGNYKQMQYGADYVPMYRLFWTQKKWRFLMYDLYQSGKRLSNDTKKLITKKTVKVK